MQPVGKFLRDELKLRARPEKAVGMAAYMKHRQAFLGVPMPEVVKIARNAAREFEPGDIGEAQQSLRALWRGGFREERYAAIRPAETWRVCNQPEALALYEWMVRKGGWWDLMDRIASVLMGGLIRNHPKLKPTVFGYIASEEMWLRCCALLCQLKFKEETDVEALEKMVLHVADEQAFFIRKAIGRALREYAKTDPESVRRFAAAHEHALSPLSRREATKNQ